MATRYVRFPQLRDEYGIPFSRTHLRRLYNAGQFPAPVHLGPNTLVWPEDQILEYSERVRAERDARQQRSKPGTSVDGIAAAPAAGGER